MSSSNFWLHGKYFAACLSRLGVKTMFWELKKIIESNQQLNIVRIWLGVYSCFSKSLLYCQEHWTVSEPSINWALQLEHTQNANDGNGKSPLFLSSWKAISPRFSYLGILCHNLLTNMDLKQGFIWVLHSNLLYVQCFVCGAIRFMVAIQTFVWELAEQACCRHLCGI